MGYMAEVTEIYLFVVLEARKTVFKLLVNLDSG